MRDGSLASLVHSGMTVAVGDGFGAPMSVLAELSDAARECGGVTLVLGWMPNPVDSLDCSAFDDVITMMPGWGLRSRLETGSARFIPTRLAALPSLLAGPLRPDLLVCSLVTRRNGLFFGTEVSWQRLVIESGAHIAAVVSTTATCADVGQPIDRDAVTVVGYCETPTPQMPHAVPGDGHRAMALETARFIEPGCRLQIGPGAFAEALLAAIEVPVAIDSGLLPEAVVGLDRRGLLLGEPVATYLAGGDSLYQWADGRQILHGVDFTHDIGRLTRGRPFVAVNTAVEIDFDAQINVEGTADALVGGIGGHPDYCAAATISPSGTSIIAMPASHRGRSTLVERLSRPVSTPSHDVQLVITPRGCVDITALDRRQRRAALSELWGIEPEHCPPIIRNIP